MERETVLEIEFKELWDNKFAWRVTKQDENILKRGVLWDDELKVYSVATPQYCEKDDNLFISGINYNTDKIISVCTVKEKELIEEKVKSINEKYGIKKRWRAEKGEYYYCINYKFDIIKCVEEFLTTNNIYYNVGNYFKTREEVEQYNEYMKKKSLEWHEKSGNYE